jgi:mono/diheme cytochrome c family protein
VKAVAFAILGAAVAMTAAFGFAATLRRAAARDSHAQPVAEAWFERARPSAPAQLASGRALFLHNCAHCHGADARGDEGPDLHDVQVSDRYIANTIARGIPHEMPAFGRKLSRDDLDALVAYVRALDAS